MYGPSNGPNQPKLGMTLPPPPGAPPGGEPADGEMIEVAARTGAITAAVLLGLRSFTGSSSLYGAFGAAMNDPATALEELITHGKRLLGQAQQGGLSQARSAQMNQALGGDGPVSLSDLTAARAERQAEIAARSRLVASYQNARVSAAIISGTERAQRAAESLTNYVKRWGVTAGGAVPPAVARHMAQAQALADERRAYKYGGRLSRNKVDFTSNEEWLRAARALDGQHTGLVASPKIPPFKGGRPGTSGLSGVHHRHAQVYGAFDIDAVANPNVAGSGKRASELFYHKRGATDPNGLVDDLADTVRGQMKTLEANLKKKGVQADLSLEKVYENGRHAYRMRWEIDGAAEQMDIGLADHRGLFRTATGHAPFAVKMSILDEADLFAQGDLNRKWAEPAHGRKIPIMRADEIAMLRMGNYFQKVIRDGEGTHDPRQLRSFARSIVEKAFKEKSVVSGSLAEGAVKALTVSTTEASVLARFRESRSYRKHLEDGLEQAERLQAAFRQGHRYWAMDTEFTSPDAAAERGQRPGAQLADGKNPYEISGTVFDRGQARASVRYVPSLFEMRSNARTKLEKERYQSVQDALDDFQSVHGAGSNKAKQIIKQIETGSLELDFEGTTYELKGRDMVAKTGTGRLKWAPTRKQSESLDAYWARLQAALFEKEDVRFSVGHNYVASELGIVARAYEVAGLEMPKAFGEVVDTLSLAHLLAPNDVGSRSLGNVAATLFGYDEEGYMDALKKIQGQLSSGQSLEALAQSEIAAAPQHREARTRFWEKILAEKKLPKGFNLHTAELDAFLTGGFVLPEIERRLRQTEAASVAQKMADLIKTNEHAGALPFLRRHQSVGFSGSGEDGTLWASLANQEGAAGGLGVAMNPYVIPFAGLAAPTRQLYQRVKPMLLEGDTANVQSRGNTTFAAGRDTGATTLVRKADGSIERVPVRVHGGYNVATPGQLALAGGGRGERAAISTLTTFLPGDHIGAMGSLARRTATVAQATRTGTDVRFQTETINVSAWETDAEQWANRQMHGAKVPTDEARRHLKEIYLIERLMADGEAGASDQMKEVGARAVNRRWRELNGLDTGGAEEAYNKGIRLGPHARLFSPSPTDASSPLLNDVSIGGSGGIADDVRITRDPNTGRTRVEVAWISDPGQNEKYLTMSTAKGFSAGIEHGTSIDHFGSQFTTEAAFDKAKRGEFSGYLQVHINRITTQGTLELEAIEQATKVGLNPTDAARQRREVHQRTAAALSQLTGGTMSAAEIERRILDTTHTNYIQLTLDEDFVRATSDAPLSRIRKALATSGLTLRGAIEVGTAATGNQSEVVALFRKGYQRLHDELGKKMKQLEGAAAYRLANPGRALPVSLDAARREVSDIRSQVGADLRRLELYKHKGASVLTELKSGAMFDLTAEKGPGGLSMSLAYRAYAATEKIANSATAGSQFGELNERSTGRATKGKVTSLLSTSMMAHAGHYAGQPQATNAIRAWLASRSGYTAFEERRLMQEVGRELDRLGIKMDPEDVKDNLRYDADRQRLILTYQGKDIALRANPFTTATDVVRGRVGLASMLRGTEVFEEVGGMRVGSSGRVVDITGQLDKFKALYGREARAAAHRKFEKATNPGQLSDRQARSFEGNTLYFKSAEELRANPLFSEAHDFVKVDVYGGFTPDEHKRLLGVLDKAGVSPAQARAVLGDPNLVKDALKRAVGGASPEEEARLTRQLDLMLGGDEATPNRMLIPTRTGVWSPNLQHGDGYIKASMGSGLAAMIDASDSIRLLNESASRIRDLADQVEKGVAGSKVALRKEIERLQAPVLREARNEVKQLYSTNFGQLARQAASAAQHAAGRFLGGRYGLAKSPATLQRGMFKAFESYKKGDINRFIDDRVAELGLDLDVDGKKRVRDRLVGYINRQSKDHGGEVWKWRGMGVAEGFGSTSAARKALDEASASLEGLKHSGEIATLGKDDPDLLKRLEGRLNDLRDAADGKGGSMLALTTRHPDFQAMMGYEFTRLEVLDDDVLRIMGVSPEDIHAYGNPVTAALRREDYDGDITFAAIIDNMHVLDKIEREVMPHQSTQLARAFRLLQDAGYADYEGGFGMPERTKGGRWVTRTPSGGHLIDPTTAGVFSFTGSALSQVMGDDEALKAYRLQKNVVGDYGGGVKRNAMQYMDVESAYVDFMDEMIDQAGRDEASVHRLFKGRAVSWDQAKGTYAAVNNIRGSSGRKGLVDALTSTQQALAAVTQEVAIEKYKGAEAEAISRRMYDVVRGLSGRGPLSYEEAIEGLLDAPTTLKAQSAFTEADDLYDLEAGRINERELDARLRQRARDAFGLRYQMAQTVEAGRQMGVDTDYLAYGANTPTADLGRDLQLAASDIDRLRQTHAVGGTVFDAGLAERTVVSKAAQSAAERFVLAEAQLMDAFEPSRQVGSWVGRALTGSGGRLAGLGLGAALLGALAMRPDNIADGEVYDTPWDRGSSRNRAARPQRGTRRTALGAATRRERALREAAYAASVGGPVGHTYAAAPPPPSSISY